MHFTFLWLLCSNAVTAYLMQCLVGITGWSCLLSCWCAWTRIQYVHAQASLLRSEVYAHTSVVAGLSNFCWTQKHFKQSLHGRINTCTPSSSSMWWVGARARAIHSLYASSSICHSTIPEDVLLTGIRKIHDVRTYVHITSCANPLNYANYALSRSPPNPNTS